MKLHLSISRWCICALLVVLSSAVVAAPFHAQRLNGGEPIVSAQDFRLLGAPESEGQNINGPSVIRVPDWIPDRERASPQAQYYMYFAHHHGEYIRLAWAGSIEGPWHLYRTGAGVTPGSRGVLDLGSERVIHLAGDYTITGHIASPDVHVDDANKRIVMYFHGASFLDGKRLKQQQTYVATSRWGLDFSAGVEPLPLSLAYLRVFDYKGALQGLSTSSYSRPRSADSLRSAPDDFDLPDTGLWESREARLLQFGELIKEKGKLPGGHKPRVRHLGLYLTGDMLHILFTVKGHAPERIFQTSVDLGTENWFDLAPATAPAEVLRAERDWEGASVPPVPSRKGAEDQLANALRDPFVFNDDGKLYLFYAGGGEQGIGVARLTKGAEEN